MRFSSNSVLFTTINSCNSECDVVRLAASSSFDAGRLHPREAAAVLRKAGRRPLSAQFTTLCNAIIDHMLHNGGCQTDMGLFIGNVATFYKRRGSLADLLLLIDSVSSLPPSSGNETQSSFWRQYYCALCVHSVPAALALMQRLGTDAGRVQRDFKDAEARESEGDIADWHQHSGATKHLVIASGIIFAACHEAADCYQPRYDGTFKRPSCPLTATAACAVAALRCISPSGCPITVEVAGRAIAAFAAPLSSAYYLGCDIASLDGVWSMLRQRLGYVCIKTPEAGSWLCNALLRCVGQMGNDPNVLWRIVRAMLRFGLVERPMPARHGGSLRGKATTSRALRIAVVALCNRCGVAAAPLCRSINEHYDGVNFSAASKTFCRHEALCLRDVMDAVCADSAAYGTPLTQL